MNRAERRRQSRAHPAKQPVIIAGDGIIAGEISNEQFEAKPSGAMPDKVRGKHRWIATAAYSLTDEQVAGAMDPAKMKYLNSENLTYLAIGCFDCEMTLGEIDVASPCRASG